MDFITIPFDKAVDRAVFDCGKHLALNEYVAKLAGQHEKKNVSRTFMLLDGHRTLQAYYTLASTSIDLSDLNELQRRGLPRYPLPAILLSRLAVDKIHQGQGLGKRLLKDVFYRVYAMAEHAGIALLIVDAKDLHAADFYKRLGFVPSPSNPLRMAILTNTFIGPIREAISAQ